MTKITAPNGEIREIESVQWSEICSVFGIYDGWFRCEYGEGNQSDHSTLLHKGLGFARIDDNPKGWTGFFNDDKGFQRVSNLTKEEAERRLKLPSFS